MVRLNMAGIVKEVGFELIKRASYRLPPDVEGCLRDAYSSEPSPMGRIVLGAILENIEIADNLRLPICQDTGLITYYLKSGRKFHRIRGIRDSLVEAVKEATEKVPLRSNVVHPITRGNTGDNTGDGLPQFHWEFDDEERLEITVQLTGGGGDNMSNIRMMRPGQSLEDIKDYVLEHVMDAGSKPCPPTVVGVGIGGSSETTLGLARKALLRPLTHVHPDHEIAGFERKLLEAINQTGIGPMGLGGKHTSLGVRVEVGHCHTASLPVGICLQCWAARRAAAIVSADGGVEYLEGADRSDRLQD